MNAISLPLLELPCSYRGAILQLSSLNSVHLLGQAKVFVGSTVVAGNEESHGCAHSQKEQLDTEECSIEIIILSIKLKTLFGKKLTVKLVRDALLELVS